MKSKGITGSTLKIIAIIAMVFDHTAWCLFDPVLFREGVKLTDIYAPLSQIAVSPVLCVLSPLFHTIGRITFPVMLFLLAEGIKYTHSKAKYIRNMAIFAILSEIPFNLAFRKSILSPGRVLTFLEGQNVFVTLTIGLAAIVLCEKLSENFSIESSLVTVAARLSAAAAFSWYFVKRAMAFFGYRTKAVIVIAAAIVLFTALTLYEKKYDKKTRSLHSLELLIIAAAALLSYAFDSDYRFTGVAALGIMHALRENRLGAFTGSCAYLTVHGYTEAGTFLALPLIKAYNGKRGLRMKYIFYIAYPGHLLILWGIRTAMGL